jgi:anti-sigma factor RsiW
MMRTDEERLDPAADHRLWQRCRDADAPEDQAARFLDLAAFADGLLDEEERDRVAALLAADPDAAEAVRAAQTLRGAVPMPPGIERIVARACEMMPDATSTHGRVVALAPRRHWVHGFAQWGSLAAALALASWLGFALGTGASLALSEPRQPSDAGFLPELFDPATGFLRDLGEGLRT